VCAESGLRPAGCAASLVHDDGPLMFGVDAVALALETGLPM